MQLSHFKFCKKAFLSMGSGPCCAVGPASIGGAAPLAAPPLPAGLQYWSPVVPHKHCDQLRVRLPSTAFRYKETPKAMLSGLLCAAILQFLN